VTDATNQYLPISTQFLILMRRLVR